MTEQSRKQKNLTDRGPSRPGSAANTRNPIATGWASAVPTDDITAIDTSRRQPTEDAAFDIGIASAVDHRVSARSHGRNKNDLQPQSSDVNLMVRKRRG